jgi:hypothetical protein
MLMSCLKATSSKQETVGQGGCTGIRTDVTEEEEEEWHQRHGIIPCCVVVFLTFLPCSCNILVLQIANIFHSITSIGPS